MAKIITKVGACASKKKPIGLQFVAKDGGYSLEGTYSISGESAIVNSEELSGALKIGAGFTRLGCKHCGNKFVYRCGSCGGFVCYDGRSASNVACPLCGAVGNVKASSGGELVTSATTSRARRTGGTTQLSQGQEVKIEFADDRPLTEIKVGVGWDPLRGSVNMDLDSSVIVAGASGYETVYYGHLEHESGCVVHHGDNLTGEGGGNADDENITVRLNKVPATRDKLYFVLNIYNCADRHQTMSDVQNMYIKLYDPVTKQPLIEYRVDSQMRNATALVIGVAYRAGGDWLFKAIGEPSNAVSVSALASEVVRKY